MSNENMKNYTQNNLNLMKKIILIKFIQVR